jgi:hypothetical protein
MYSELKMVRVVGYFIFIYSMNWAFNTVWKFDFLKKCYVIGHCKCHFVFQHTKIHKEGLNFSKTFFSRRPVLTVGLHQDRSLCVQFPSWRLFRLCSQSSYLRHSKSLGWKLIFWIWNCVEQKMVGDRPPLHRYWHSKYFTSLPFIPSTTQYLDWDALFCWKRMTVPWVQDGCVSYYRVYGQRISLVLSTHHQR